MQELALKEFSEKKEISSKGYALFSKEGNFQPYEFKRHAVGERCFDRNPLCRDLS